MLKSFLWFGDHLLMIPLAGNAFSWIPQNLRWRVPIEVRYAVTFTNKTGNSRRWKLNAFGKEKLSWNHYEIHDRRCQLSTFLKFSKRKRVNNFHFHKNSHNFQASRKTWISIEHIFLVSHSFPLNRSKLSVEAISCCRYHLPKKKAKTKLYLKIFRFNLSHFSGNIFSVKNIKFTSENAKISESIVLRHEMPYSLSKLD